MADGGQRALIRTPRLHLSVYDQVQTLGEKTLPRHYLCNAGIAALAEWKAVAVVS